MKVKGLQQVRKMRQSDMSEVSATRSEPPKIAPTEEWLAPFLHYVVHAAQVWWCSARTQRVSFCSVVFSEVGSILQPPGVRSGAR